MHTQKSIVLLLTALALVLPAYAVSGGEGGGGGGLMPGCYDSVTTIPASCEGGTITAETNSGSCRTITCTNSTSHLTVMACGKPDQGTPQYFEMYRQSISGNAVKEICLGDTCIAENGYVKGTLPVCMSAQAYCGDGIISNPEQCDGSAPNGMVCSSDCVLYQEQACDVVHTFREGQSFNFTTPLYSYEVTLVQVMNQSVRLDFNGEAAPELAFDNLLLTDEGTVIMLNDILLNAQEGVATLCVQKPKPQNVSIVIAPGYPQNMTFVFMCRPNGNIATDYLWDFGDGTTEYGGAGGYHTYAADGDYKVTCNVTNSVDEATGSMIVVVHGPPDVTNTTNQSNATQNSTNQAACYGSVKDIPASCVGGVLLSDTFNGCRTLQCAGSGSSMQVLACDKGAAFEMYKQTQTGNGISKICIGSTCISDNGFAKSNNYPICMNIATNETGGNITNTTDRTPPILSNIQPNSTQSPGTTSVMLSVTTNEIAECRVDAAGRAYPEMTLVFSTTNGLTHTFNFSGNLPGNDYLLYVGCSDLAGNVNTTTIAVNVPAAPITNSSVSLSIAPWYPKGNDYILVCNANGFTPTSYDWRFGDGQTLNNHNQNNIYHTYASAGSYNVQCTAKNGAQTGTGTLAISVGGVTPPVNQTNGTVTPPMNRTNQTNTTTCYSNIKNVPAKCTGGTITQDTYNGCRAVTCANGGSSLQVLACDKPDGSATPTRFELYKQGQTGSLVTKLCLGSACISDNGFASQSYPVCTS